MSSPSAESEPWASPPSPDLRRRRPPRRRLRRLAVSLSSPPRLDRTGRWSAVVGSGRRPRPRRSSPAVSVEAAAFDVRRRGAAVFSGAWKSGTGTAATGRASAPPSVGAVSPVPASAGAAVFLVVRLRVVVFFAGGASPDSADVAAAGDSPPDSAVAAVFLVVRLRGVVFFAGGVSPDSATVAAAGALARLGRGGGGLLGGPLARRRLLLRRRRVTGRRAGLGGGGTVLLIVEHVAPRPGRCAQPRTCPAPTARVVRADGAKPSVAATPSAGASTGPTCHRPRSQAIRASRCHQLSQAASRSGDDRLHCAGP